MNKQILLKFYMKEGELLIYEDGKLVKTMRNVQSGGGGNSTTTNDYRKLDIKSKSKLPQDTLVKDITSSSMVNNHCFSHIKQGYSESKPKLDRMREVSMLNRGGPIPAGEYIISSLDESSPTFIKSKLKHISGKDPLNRTNLLIHGAGFFGSDGCIVTAPGEWHILKPFLEKIDIGSQNGKLIVHKAKGEEYKCEEFIQLI